MRVVEILYRRYLDLLVELIKVRSENAPAAREVGPNGEAMAEITLGSHFEMTHGHTVRGR